MSTDEIGSCILKILEKPSKQSMGVTSKTGHCNAAETEVVSLEGAWTHTRIGNGTDNNDDANDYNGNWSFYSKYDSYSSKV